MLKVIEGKMNKMKDINRKMLSNLHSRMRNIKSEIKNSLDWPIWQIRHRKALVKSETGQLKYHCTFI